MDPDLIKTITHYLEERPEVVAVYLFGSHARGRERPSSDIDLGILVEHGIFMKDTDLKMIYTVDLSRLLRKDSHVVIMNNAGEGILAQIFKHGKCIFAREHEMLSRFKTFTYSRIADFGYHRSLMEKAFVSRILGDDR